MVIDTQTPIFSWDVEHEGERALFQANYQLKIYQEDTLFWDSGVVESESTVVVYSGHNTFESDSRYRWTINVHSSSGMNVNGHGSFVFGLDIWNATWIGGYRQLRREFSLDLDVDHAMLYFSGLGWSSAFINGQNIAPNERQSPTWTEYNKTVVYQGYDVTDLLESGTNAIGVLLGGGFYVMEGYGTHCLLLQLAVHMKDGSTITVSSDTENWQGNPDPPIVSDDVYIGEVFDSNLVESGWANAGFMSNWPRITTMHANPPPGKLIAQAVPPISTHEEIAPVSIKQWSTNTYIYDFGQNMAGICRLELKSQAKGNNVTLRYAEVLLPSGDIDQRNLRQAISTDQYITNNDEIQTFLPLFTYHGFRYVKVETTTSIVSLAALPISTIVPMDGSVEFESKLLNDIQNALIWTQRSNLMGFPTSCCNRNERTGWLSDAGLMSTSAVRNFDVHAIHRSWLHSVMDSQKLFEYIPDVSPRYSGRGGPADPAWGTAYPYMTWLQWKEYGDIDAVMLHYPGIKQWLSLLAKEAQPGIQQLVSKYGDWQPPREYPKINGSFVSACFYMRDLHCATDLATAIGRHEDAAEFQNTRRSLMSEFNDAWFSDGTYGNGTQSELALVLATPGLVDSDDVIAQLVSAIEDVGHHFTTGIQGAYMMPIALSAVNRSDVLMDMLAVETYPSFGYVVSNDMQPGTTFWEIWSAPFDPDQTIANSRNHPMYTAIGTSFYDIICGMRQATVTTAYIKPVLVPGLARSKLSACACHRHTARGHMSLKWRVDSDKFLVDTEIPIGSTALVYMPARQNSIITEGSKTVWSDGKFVPGDYGVVSGEFVHEWGDEWVVVSVESGVYSFRVN